MDDPWSNTVSKNLPSIDLNSGPLSQEFDDNFSPLELKVVTPHSSEKPASFEPLPDSSTYLANLGNWFAEKFCCACKCFPIKSINNVCVLFRKKIVKTPEKDISV